MQLRNTIMACTLFAQASAYIAARALPTSLLDKEYNESLFKLGVSQLPHLLEFGLSCPA